MTFGRDDDARQRKWALIVEHRTRLVRLAQSLGLGRADAEDCAHDAMIRVANLDDLDERTLSGLLTTVTKRSAVDQHRARASQARAWLRHAGRRDLDSAPDERACDLAQAAHARQLLPGLPERERAVLLLRATGMSTAEAAEALGVTAKSAEGALTRARARLVRRVVVVVGAAGVVKNRLTASSAPAWAATAAVAVGVVAMPFLPAAEPGDSAVAAPPTTSTAPAGDDVVRTRPVPTMSRPVDVPVVKAVEPHVVRPRTVAGRHRTTVGASHQVGPVRTRPGWIERGEEPYLQALQRCIDEGVVVSVTFVGCRPPDGSQ